MHLYVELWKAKLIWLDLPAQERQGCIQSIGPKMRMLCRTLDVFAVVVFLTAGVIAQDTAPDWPQWRGPNRDGTVASFTAPRPWPERLTLGWRVDVGEGYATPVLVGGRIYMFTRQGDDEVMRALDADTGGQIWQTSYPAPFSFEPAAEPHGPGPKATPTFADGKLYTLGLGGVVTAFDAATGRQVWQIPAPLVAPLWGTAASPLVDQGLVIVHVGGHDQGALTAFDADTGEVRWAWDSDGPSYASPLVADLSGTRQVITLSQERVIGVSASTGELLWQRPFSTLYTQSVIDPILVEDMVIIAGFQEPTSAFRVVREQNQWTTEDIWENRETSLYMTNGVLVNGMLFGLSQRNSGQYFLLDVATGETLWTSVGRQASNAAIVKAGETLFVLEDDAELIVGRATAAGFEEVRRYDVADAATWAQPTISGNRVFVKAASTLTLWTFD